MKIVVAPTAFKGSLSAVEAANAIADGIRNALPNAKIVKIPVADGGDGTLEVLTNACCGKIFYRKVTNPIGKPVRAGFGIIGRCKRQTAIIETAEASGLKLVPQKYRNPLRTTTYGTGELILSALDKGVRRIIIGVGGSATVDGGAGAIMALGGRFIDNAGRDISCYDIAGLRRLSHINLDDLDKRLSKCKITVASDVRNKLLGRNGAAKVFAPQKGASPKQVALLEDCLSRLAEIVRKNSGMNIRNIEGGGAAGGLAGGLVCILDAKIVNGATLVMSSLHFKRHLKGADLVITGEGIVDDTTFSGKVVLEVIKSARKLKAKVGVICGEWKVRRVNKKITVDFIEEIITQASSQQNAVKNACRYIRKSASNMVKKYLE